jgi:hypothetical protein
MFRPGYASPRTGWRWDVALSFAGAQRGYVEQVAKALKARGYVAVTTPSGHSSNDRQQLSAQNREVSAMSLEKVMCVPAMCAIDRAYTVKM